ncbi:type II toxin-antitoxin system RelE/ParE family toxin [Amycolatopsis sp. 195334CR]|uniref:type II toxin-antitoxin system RelE family toxin n=1 Tax=Amycolatopsis sp. 195334CR TaxID=2814588 RepID=UPI001A8D058E|nr:type II toxin-antitoxin system RelE/ParE family toxin [Amycolatopsis sp. 195334CR]MBN6034435.1 type II toxin-antitoxin system RelE/ParE family toxin [Amycolatopsis sp. 195334CR]
MSYEVELTGCAEKFLDKLSKGQPRDVEALENAIEDLATEPRPSGCRKLSGCDGVMRVRVGGYRIYYTIDDGKLVVLVIVISTRDNVYEAVRRQLGR